MYGTVRPKEKQQQDWRTEVKDWRGLPGLDFVSVFSFLSILVSRPLMDVQYMKMQFWCLIFFSFHEVIAQSLTKLFSVGVQYTLKNSHWFQWMDSDRHVLLVLSGIRSHSQRDLYVQVLMTSKDIPLQRDCVAKLSVNKRRTMTMNDLLRKRKTRQQTTWRANNKKTGCQSS